MKTRSQVGPREAVLAALANLEGFAPRRRGGISIADLRDRLLQMSSRELDATLLALDEEGRVELEPIAPGHALRERAAAVAHPIRGLLGQVKLRRRARGAPRRRSERMLTLQVLVPTTLLRALDPLGPSRSQVARDLLERILDRRQDDRRFARLRSSILSAIAAEAQRTGAATLWDVRQRLSAIPQAELDRALLALEARGALVLAPRPEGTHETERDVHAALWCARRGALSRVQLPVPQSRMGPPAKRRRRRTA